MPPRHVLGRAAGGMPSSRLSCTWSRWLPSPPQSTVHTTVPNVLPGNQSHMHTHRHGGERGGGGVRFKGPGVVAQLAVHAARSLLFSKNREKFAKTCLTVSSRFSPATLGARSCPRFTPPYCTLPRIRRHGILLRKKHRVPFLLGVEFSRSRVVRGYGFCKSFLQDRGRARARSRALCTGPPTPSHQRHG